MKFVKYYKYYQSNKFYFMGDEMINEKQIEYLLAVVREGNITKAAKQLYVSQPALSQMILGIERELGTDLFDRDHNPLRLTYAGEQYMDACMRVKSIHNSTRKTIMDIIKGERGSITLGMSMHLSIFLSHQIIPRFHEQYPNFEIKLVESNVDRISQMVRQGQIDLAIVYRRDQKDLTYEIVTHEQIFLAAPPSYYHERSDWHYGINEQPLHMNEVSDWPFILLKKGRGVRAISDKIMEQFQIFPKVVLETDSIEVAHRLAKKDMGFTFIPPLGLYYHDVNIDGVYFPLRDYISDRSIYLCYRQDSFQSEAMQDLRKIIFGIISGCYMS